MNISRYSTIQGVYKRAMSRALINRRSYLTTTNTWLQDRVHINHLNYSFQARLLQFPLSQYQPFTNKTPSSNPERYKPRSHKNSQTSLDNSCPQITSLVKSPLSLKHPLQNSISYLQSLQTSQPSYIRQLLTIQTPSFTRSSSYMSQPRHPFSSSLKFSNRLLVHTAPAPWNGLPKDLRQFAHPPNALVPMLFGNWQIGPNLFGPRLVSNWQIRPNLFGPRPLGNWQICTYLICPRQAGLIKKKTT